MKLISAIFIIVFVSSVSAFAEPIRHNLIFFIADGLRPGMVMPETAATLARLMSQGVRFTNTHSMFPTFTTPNASAMATGHRLGDTGDFSNTIDAGFQVPGAGDSLTPFLESDPVLGDVDEHYSGDYLNQDTVMKAARGAGLNTASIGKLGPVLIFDHTERSGEKTLIFDDSTGRPSGIPLNEEIKRRLEAAGLPLEAPSRGENSKAGDFQNQGALRSNDVQQAYFVNVTNKVILPKFKQDKKPFMLVFWSRDPDGTQHNQGDSLNRLVPGINGPTSLKAIQNADNNLAQILSTLKVLGLEETTNIIIASDHGFSTISKESATSFAATQSYKDVVKGFLPPGFLAIDLAHGLNMPLVDPDEKYQLVPLGEHSKRSNGLIGGDKMHPRLVIAANGGSDLVYIPDGDRELAKRVVEFLSSQDYVSGLFVSDDLGPIAGTLPLSQIDLKGSAVTPLPSIVVNFRSFSTGCTDPLNCGVEIADYVLQQGQGIHGSFSRADTAIVSGASGPDFRQKFIDPAPMSNADLGKTMAHLLKLKIHDKGKLIGRVLFEAMPRGMTPRWKTKTLISSPDRYGNQTAVQMQSIGSNRYFDAAGYPGRTLGLTTRIEQRKSR
ncbi:nucleotide pyrophosphatase [Methylocystaceae bacterium]|nr:nucleotide pyrophosphatase [Methylocystaceae bacterium]